MATPREDGFRMPGEFEPHALTWMAFPHRADNWRNNAKDAQKAICNLANLVSKFEKVIMIVPRRCMREALSSVDDTVSIVVGETDDAWVRDTGATFVTNGKEIRGVSWGFNAWGGVVNGLYSSWKHDEKVAEFMCKIQGASVYKPSFILEGGSIHVDGEGTCMTTVECLLDVGRNCQFTGAELEENLKKYLNVEKIIWLENGVVDDETNGHIDNMAAFARPGEIVLTWTDDTSHPQYPRSKAAYDYLTTIRDAKDRRFIVHKMHIPDDMYTTEEEAQGVVNSGEAVVREAGDRLAASYVNFIMPNGAIIFPTFGDEKYDKLAEEQFKKIFPDRKVIGFYSRELLLGGGNLHCLTQQMCLPY
jgi:agmatine deiminase